MPRVFRCRLQMIQRPGDPCQATSLYTCVVQLPGAAEANPHPQFQCFTTEAGYMAIGASGQDALWLHLFCVELNSLTTTTEIRCDNRCAGKEVGYWMRTKHIDLLRHHFIKEPPESYCSPTRFIRKSTGECPDESSSVPQTPLVAKIRL